MPFCPLIHRFSAPADCRPCRRPVRAKLPAVSLRAAIVAVAMLSHLASGSTAANADEPSEAAGAVEPADRTYPSLPGAVHKAPDWLKKNAPFDVDAFFIQVPPEENAAPLYLEALYEFAPRDMETCVSPEEREARGAALRERQDRMQTLLSDGGEAATRAALLDEYEDAFALIAAAQKRKRCVFDVGYALDADLPHAQAARAVVRLLNWRVEFALADRDIGAALDSIEMGLRLGRDLRPRGPIVSQLVGNALDAIILYDQIYGVLGSPDLRLADCDRLLKLLAMHRSGTLNPVIEGFRGNYIFVRDLLHRLEMKEQLGDLLGAPASSNGAVLASRMAEGDRTREIGEQIDERLAEMGEAHFAAEVDALNRYFAPVVNQGDRPTREFDRLVPEQEEALADMTVLSLLNEAFGPRGPWVEAYRRDRTRMGAIACVAALRRWYLGEPHRQPPDLLTVCKAAGMKQVPTDEYSRTGEPLRWIKNGGQFIVYSVAKGGKDDKAERDWNFGRNPGDFIFLVPVVLDP